GDGDKVPLFRNVRLHLPDLPPNGRAPIGFRCLVVLGNARHEFFQALPSTNTSHRSNDNEAVPRGNVNIVADRNMSVLKHLPGKTQPLAVTPFLDFRHHISTSYGYPR